jgi:replicative DNA helicase
MSNSTTKVMVPDPLKHTGGKIPPQAIDLEEAVLGSIMTQQDNADTVMAILPEEAFYNQSNRLVFKAIKSLFLRRSAIDILTVSAELKKSGELEIVGGYFYVTNLTSKTVNAGNVETHSYLIKEAFYKREVIRICADSISQAYNDTSDPFDLVEGMTKVYDVISSDIGKSLMTIGDSVIQRLKAYEEIIENGITGVPSGFKSLDRITAGWQKSDLIIIAGRPAMGKTAFVVNCARNAAVDHKKPVLVFSLEMSTAQLTDRMISAESEIDGDTIRTRSLADWQWSHLHGKIDTLVKAPIIIDDTPALSILQFTAKAKKAKKDHDIQMIIIDYLQLMKGTREKGVQTNREQEISSISRALKAVAKELDIPVLALSQLSRAAETRPGAGGKRPRLSDLRESGAIEQDADLVLFLYRPEYYGVTEDEQGRSLIGLGEIIVAKHRSGSTGTAVLRFIGKYTKFTDLEDDFGDTNFTQDLLPSPSAGISASNLYDGDDDAPF